MVPLRDDNPITTTPFIVYGLIALNVVVFLHQLSLAEAPLAQFYQAWAIIPNQLSASFSQDAVGAEQEWVTLISSQFLHGSPPHLLGNMLYLWIFGNNIEDRLGHLRFLFFYLACGALAGLAQWIFDPTSGIPTLGASGAIAGVMGAYILRFPQAKIVTFVALFMVRIPAIVFLGWWFIQQAFYSLMSLDATANVGAQGGVAYWAHAAGFVFGMILGPLLGLFSQGPRSGPGNLSQDFRW